MVVPLDEYYLLCQMLENYLKTGIADNQSPVYALDIESNSAKTF